MRMTLGTVTAFVLLLTAATASATALPGPEPTRAEMRAEIQRELILEALWEGDIPMFEAKTLLYEQSIVTQWRSQFEEDGVLSEREWKVLDYIQDVATQNIDRRLRQYRKPAPQPTAEKPSDRSAETPTPQPTTVALLD